MSTRALPCLAAALLVLSLAACGSKDGDSSGPSTHPTSAAADDDASSPASDDKTACDLVTAAELSQAAGVTYASEKADPIGCEVTGTQPQDSFLILMSKGDSDAAWAATLATTKEDDGSYTEVDGIGDRAAQGAIKEFDVQAGGYILVVHGADVNTSGASSFTRSRAIAQLLAQKLG